MVSQKRKQEKDIRDRQKIERKYMNNNFRVA